jgi:hypothetical protein
VRYEVPRSVIDEPCLLAVHINSINRQNGPTPLDGVCKQAPSVNTGGASPSLLAASSAVPMTILNELPDPVGVGGVEKKK